MVLADKIRVNKYAYKRMCLRDHMDEYGRANGIKGYLSSTDWNRLNFILRGEAHWKLIRSDILEYHELLHIVTHPMTKARLRKKLHKLILGHYIKVKENPNIKKVLDWNFKF